jgi:hypothetical protein
MKKFLLGCVVVAVGYTWWVVLHILDGVFFRGK